MSPRQRRIIVLIVALLVGMIGMGVSAATPTLTWSSVAKGVEPFGGVIDVALSANDDTLYVAGSFRYATQSNDDTLPLHRVGQWRVSDGQWVPMGKGLNDEAAAIVGSSNDATVYVGGNFAFATQRTDDTVTLNRIGRWRASDDTWLPMGKGVDIGQGFPPVRALAVRADDAVVYAAGSFTTATQRTNETITLNYIGAWRAADDTWLPMGKGVGRNAGSGVVNSIGLGPTGTVYAGGVFDFATQRTDDTVLLRNVGSWSSVDDTWRPLGGGVNSQVNALAIVGDVVVVTGPFTAACGDAACASPVSAAYIAGWNTTTQQWTTYGAGLPAPGRSITVLPGGGIGVSLVTGSLYTWDGSTWTVTATADFAGFDELTADDTYIYAGGLFTTIDGTGTFQNIARAAFGSPGPGPGPDPDPVFPPGAPGSVSAVAGDAQVEVTWTPPASSGSYRITDYEVVSAPGSRICLAKAPVTSCTVSGLVNGASYTFTVRALNGAGWGPFSSPSGAVTPVPVVQPSIVIIGARDDQDRRIIRVRGVTTGLVGETVTPYLRFPGQSSYAAGLSTRTVAADGTFTWQRQANRKTYLYFRHAEARSNGVVIAAR